REIRLQYIRLDDRHRGAACIALLKMRREIAVQLDRDQPLRAFGEQVGDRTTTRADLDHALRVLCRHEVHDPLTNSTVDQEVLAESLACSRKLTVAPWCGVFGTSCFIGVGAQLRATTSVRSSRLGVDPTCESRSRNTRSTTSVTGDDRPSATASSTASSPSLTS